MEKAISFFILVTIGVLFRKKVRSKEQLGAIKTLILSLALPAVIFSALVNIDVAPSLLYPPAAVLLCNFLLFFSIRLAFSLLPRNKLGQADKRTLRLMLPSLAPYLSCFPFLSEFASDSTIGIAAVADTGNKVFILIFLYLLSMYWVKGQQSTDSASAKPSRTGFKKNLDVLLQPINMAILAALAASLMGINLVDLPVSFQESLSHLRGLLTPTVLIFIGLAVKFSKQDSALIVGMLLWRSAISFLLSAILISLVGFSSVETTLLAVALPQSACSFIPYAQMSVLSEERKSSQPAFNQNLALSILALSLPFSALVIVSIYSSGDFFTMPSHLSGLGVVTLCSAAIFFRQTAQRYRKVSSRVLSSPQSLSN